MWFIQTIIYDHRIESDRTNYIDAALQNAMSLYNLTLTMTKILYLSSYHGIIDPMYKCRRKHVY